MIQLDQNDNEDKYTYMAINKNELSSVISKCFKDNSLSCYLSQKICEKFIVLAEIMLEENEKYNLTAITAPDKIALLHFADSVTLAGHLKEGASIVDVGCGAGFPTLPLAIVRPDLRITAIDSTAKRVNYVNETAAKLGLTNVTAIAVRAEDFGKADGREKFDYATARAVAALPILLELCLPLVKVGGELLAMKGKNAEYELSASKKAISLLGGKLKGVEEIKLVGDGDGALHPIIKVSKISKTPISYPRAYAQISKKPL